MPPAFGGVVGASSWRLAFALAATLRAGGCLRAAAGRFAADFLLFFRAAIGQCSALMYSAQAFIWLRIGASEVPMFGPVSTTPSFSVSRPK